MLRCHWCTKLIGSKTISLEEMQVILCKRHNIIKTNENYAMFYCIICEYTQKTKKNKKGEEEEEEEEEERKKVFKNQIYFCQDYHFVIVVVVGKEKLLNLDICLYILLDIVMSYFTLSFSHNTFYAIDCCL